MSKYNLKFYKDNQQIRLFSHGDVYENAEDVNNAIFLMLSEHKVLTIELRTEND